MAAIDDLMRQVTAAAKAQDAKLAAGASPMQPAAKRLGLVWPIGTAVLDLVTGLKGVVVDGKRENVILPPT